MIHMKNIDKKYGKYQLLKGVSLDIHEGEIFGLLGENGAGKSTLVSILATVLKPSAGSVVMKGLDLSKHKKQIRQMIGFVPQEIALWEEFTVKENFHFWSRFVSVKPSEEKLLELCEAVSLRDKWNEKVSNLSGGMKRKLNIAVALIHDPAILLMDEPTVGIDLQSKLEINQYMKKMAQQGKTIVYITHDIHEMIHLCDRVGVLSKGGIRFVGTLEEARESLDMAANQEASIEDVVCHLLRC
ncbi:ABC transporter ATP-binding protein [Bacillus sp. V3B]|uniref:ABC transporter ATP-binding protein n=1 Tax=Bacillus sp. V3B TaxID=2804915 RepID=UPI00210EAE36|nr:ABC transporter ATP-binding protein [Bacillus sp. V3B]MCQ6277092.1 ABC transporter ATP-binding protein [Bacillus sp. V3B]